MLTAGYLINRTPSLVLNGKTPYSVLYGKEPTYDHLCILGSLFYAHVKTGNKFASRSRRFAFVGYPYGKKGWHLYDLEKRDFFVSRDVLFSKGVFPFVDNFLFDNDGLPDDEMVHEDLEESPTPVLRGVDEFVRSACEPNGDAGQLVCVSQENDPGIHEITTRVSSRVFRESV